VNGVDSLSRLSHSPLHLPVQSLPAAVERLGLEPSARHASLQRLLTGARVDDEASVRAVNHSPEEVLVLHAALPVGARQRLTAAHDDLRSDWCESSRSVFSRVKRVPAAGGTRERAPHHAVLPVVVAEDGEATPLSEFGRLFQHVVPGVLGDDDGWRVRGTHPVVPVHGAQPPPVMLRERERERERTIKPGHSDPGLFFNRRGPCNLHIQSCSFSVSKDSGATGSSSDGVSTFLCGMCSNCSLLKKLEGLYIINCYTTFAKSAKVQHGEHGQHPYICLRKIKPLPGGSYLILASRRGHSSPGSVKRQTSIWDFWLRNSLN